MSVLTSPGQFHRLLLFMLGLTVLAGLGAADFHVAPTGKDTDPGTALKPWKTVVYGLSRMSGGDILHLAAGATFTEYLYLAPGAGGTSAAPKTIIGDPAARAVLAPIANDQPVVYGYNSAGLVFANLRFVGPGMDIHQKDGVSFYADDGQHRGLTFRNCEFTGFGGNGLVIGGWNGTDRGFGGVLVEDCDFHHSRKCGFNTYAQYASGNTSITVRRSRFADHRGDPTAASHTGSGLILSGVTDGLVEHCLATRNGDRCTTTGGPVGMWAYMATRVTFQFCESYANRAVNCDGGGFDLDGGCQDCVIQYCYSHDNDGAGYLLCQYSGARAFTGNTVRFCISENDGRRQTGTRMAGIHFYSAGSNGGLQGTRIHNNTVFNSVAPAVWFQVTSGQTGTTLRDNLFVTTAGKALVQGSPSTAVALFQGNAYWSSGAAWSVAGYATLDAWRSAKGQEMLAGAPVGLNADPLLTAPGTGGVIGDTGRLSTLTAYALKPGSPCADGGLDLAALFGLAAGGRDFYGNPVPAGSGWAIGAHEPPVNRNRTIDMQVPSGFRWNAASPTDAQVDAPSGGVQRIHLNSLQTALVGLVPVSPG
ncbi:hypothetical protein LBMAG53_34620 [Planctomycetota bacterium]|nr:hypothetical protein LBMAG53_34620 [Planctomycetota bacterium]